MFIMNNSSENGGGLMSVITLIAAAGSVIGSLLFPGIGTVIGSVDMLYIFKIPRQRFRNKPRFYNRKDGG